MAAALTFYYFLFILGIVVKAYPIKPSERYNKLCKIVLKEDVEKPTRNSPHAVINTFLLGELAHEGGRICEGDRVVLSEVVVEFSPTDEHQFQLIVWRKKSQASIWVINSNGKVRANIRTEAGTSTSSDEFEEPRDAKRTEKIHHGTDSDEGEHIIYESRENVFSKSTSEHGQGIKKTKQKVFETRKGKFHLGPKGVTPTTSHVRRRSSDLVVLLDKGEAKRVMKTFQEDEYHTRGQSKNAHSKDQPRTLSRDCCKEASTYTPANTPAGPSNAGKPNASTPNASEQGVGNVNASIAPPGTQIPKKAVESDGQTMIMSPKTGPKGTRLLSLSIQSTNPDQPSNIQCTHIEMTPSRVSTRIWNGGPHAMRDQPQLSAVPDDLPQFLAPEAGISSTKACEEEDKELEIGTRNV